MAAPRDFYPEGVGFAEQGLESILIEWIHSTRVLRIDHNGQTADIHFWRHDPFLVEISPFIKILLEIPIAETELLLIAPQEQPHPMPHPRALVRVGGLWGESWWQCADL